MALYNCNNCDNEISKKNYFCMYCNASLRNSRPIISWAFFGFMTLVVAANAADNKGIIKLGAMNERIALIVMQKSIMQNDKMLIEQKKHLAQ